ncbi:cupin domain-containing protein [Flavivirga jejuensis]|uniref:Cupin domain-containing protein n=1 Tax=Flavivirga jejuensis TaxID=870487 RepID=A0ABT8WTZ6_9FLAO|nr:cupin domain-containing protein [Flavivirga jejuensis]MDO5976361.1 cupin domain-containing protein [Flavivirga jejuensis]
MRNVKLEFLPPLIEKEIMVVEEVVFNTNNIQLAPFKASRWEVFPGKSSLIDVHEVRECWFIAKGEGELIRNEKKEGKVKQGDILFFDSNESHSICNSGKENILIFSIWWNV